MPLKSKAQARKFRAMAASGEISEDTLDRWLAHTKSVKNLPERVKRRKKSRR